MEKCVSRQYNLLRYISSNTLQKFIQKEASMDMTRRLKFEKKHASVNRLLLNDVR